MSQQTTPPRVSLSLQQNHATTMAPDKQSANHQSSIVPAKPTDYHITKYNRTHALVPWSEPVQAVLEQPPASLTKRLIIAGLFFFGLSITWAWLGKVEDVSHAQGRLIPQGDVYKVQAVVGGEVAHIFVEEGESIKVGQVIAELDRQMAEHEIDRLTQQHTTYQLELSQIQGLIDRNHAELNTLRAIAQANLQAQTLEIEQSHINALTSETMLGQLHEEHHAYERRLDRLNPLVEAGALAEESLFDVEQSLRDRQQAITQQEGTLERTNAEISQLHATLEQHQAEAERQVLEMQQKLQRLEIDASELQAKIKDTEINLTKARTEAEQMHLHAPVDGIISDLTIQNIGEVVQSGTTIVEIAPDNTPLVLSANLPSSEAGLVNPGMPVKLKFDAFPYQDYGVIPGKIITLAPDSDLDETLGTTYHVEIQLERNHVEHEGQIVKLRAGQTAKAEIVTRQRRILDIFFEPFRKLQKGGISL
ncbi:MAG: HlyD family efflux transporter periplasmic adaptor subunit [Cyanobacteria bacterium P01_E01_bin.6]